MHPASRFVVVSSRLLLAAGVAALAIEAACSDDSSPPPSATFPDAAAPTPTTTTTPTTTATTPPVGPTDAGTDAPVDAASAYDVAHCAGETDPYWTSVLAYVPCTATIGDVSGQSTLTPFNAPTVSATPTGAPGGASCSLGNGGTIMTAKGFAIAMPAAIGTGDFTVEITTYQTAWFEPTDQQSELIIGITAYPPSPGKFPSFFSHSGIDGVQYIGGTAEVSYRDGGGTLNEWDSYAASRIGGTVYVFRNGRLLTSFADATNYTDTTAYVGHQSNGSYNAVMGSVGQIRITAASRYKAGYTACTAGFATK